MIGLQRKHLPPGVGTALGRARSWYPGLVVVVDVVAWLPAFWLAGLLRSELGAETIPWARIFAVALLGMVLFLTVAMFSQLYANKWRTATFEEVVGLAITWLPAAGGVFVINAALLNPRVPTSVAGFGAALALLSAMFARVLWRFAREALNRPDPRGRMRVLVFGAGHAGASVVQSMQTNPNSSYVPVAILDDNPRLLHRVVYGVPVLGDRSDIGKLAGQSDIMVIAIPSASGEVIDELSALGESHSLEVKVLPSVGEMIGMLASIEDARAVEITDLLGRDEVAIDRVAVGSYIQGQRVLITGAGGSIGAELCRQVSNFAPEALIMVDRDETALQSVQLSIAGHGLLDDPNLVLADIRDRERIDEVFASAAPTIVFHAAALKHLPLLEAHPKEALLTNVIGTQNVLEAAEKTGVKLFVNVSTDKAADPSSVLGSTKRLAEVLTAATGQRSDGDYVSVRFGNVLASRGSVIPAFEQQILAGGPVTVTHPEATRYFMTIPEAARLILQGGALAKTGEVLVLDMGEPMLILDLAKKLIRHHHAAVEIEFTGLRPNEKLHEVLVDENEALRSGPHPRIWHTSVEPTPGFELDLDGLSELSGSTLAQQLLIECRPFTDRGGMAETCGPTCETNQ